MSLHISHRQTTFWDFTGPGGTQRVHFLQKQEQSFVSPECDGFAVVTQHPALLNYQHPWSSIYISSAPPEPAGMLDDVTSRIASVVAPWRRGSDYFNNLVDPLTLLREGSGLFVHAPQPLAALGCAALDAAAVAYSVQPSRPLGAPMQALIAGPNFVVAREFRIERGPNNSFMGMPLRGTP